MRNFLGKPLKICFACTAFRGKYRVTKKDDIQWWSSPYGQNPWEKAIILDPEKRATFCEIGLTLWKEAIDDFSEFKEFDVVYVFGSPIQEDWQFYNQRWWVFPKLIKEAVGDDTMVFFSIDNSPNWQPQYLEARKKDCPKCMTDWKGIKEQFDAVDMIIGVTPPVLKYWRTITKTPVFQVPAPREYVPDHKELTTPFNKRVNEVAIMFNTFPWCRLDTQIEVVKQLGCKARVFSGWFGWQGLRHTILKAVGLSTAERLKISEELESKGISTPSGDTWEFEFRTIGDFTFYKRHNYLPTLSPCKVGLHDNYEGGSRFSSESAQLQIPVVGSNNIEALEKCAPDLATDPRDVSRQVDLITRLFYDSKFYKEQSKAFYRRVQEYYSYEACLERLFEAFNEVGVEV